jgi:uncharacterized protein YdiU (UPF0061 family)
MSETDVRPYQPATDHAELGSDFYDPVSPASFPKHVVRYRNDRWARRVGLSEEEWIRFFGRFEPLEGSFAQPLALRYHGHQFRSYNPDLGDGRGFLYAQLRDLEDGRLLDLATKGSGQTPWSRQGDGRLTLKGGVREILATEMLEALGVYTSKSFSLIETGERLHRGDEPSPTRSAVLVRLGHSHIRIGTFQRLLYLDEPDNIAKLVDYAVQRYLPEARRDDASEQAVAFLQAVCGRVAATGAQWMTAGFVHGVLNTDNINITGESFDYGPWRFLPVLDSGFTAAYFDHSGLYAFGRQPDTLLWNLTRLAECLLPLAEKPALEAALRAFEPALQTAFGAALGRRLGLASAGAEADAHLARVFWMFLSDSKAPYEQAFFDWRGGLESEARAADSPAREHYALASFAPVHEAFTAREAAADANLDHPYFSRREPCTMLIDEVEALWEPIAAADDWTAFRSKIAEIREMADAYGVEPRG